MGGALAGLGVALGAGLAPVLALAAELPARAPAMVTTERVIEVATGLAVVVGIIVAAAWGARRLLRMQPGGHGELRVLAGVSLGTRERAVLIEVGDTRLLVGVAPGSLRTLHVLAGPGKASGTDAATRDGFAGELARASASGGRGR